ncbi:type VI secretion system lipoprotein TssJ [Geobacter sp.]|uniref:type VI secretion system lipoprotein TssJ n=1 Tax=Geobacter sp. TaxID=46610 RepID=UPI0026269E5E|nr:type VI secretion system lipoprotein TssJ [Geobacter sp.]
MKRRIALHLLPFAFLGLSACSSTPEVRPSVEWGFEKEAIRLHLTGDRQLNLFQRTPHALVACLYQLRDPNAFNQLRSDPDGLAKLLECGRFDPGVATTKQLVIQPGEVLAETLDRAEGARYIGFVAGYYNLHKEGTVRLYPIPAVEETRGWFSRTTTVKPGAIDIRLILGPRELQDATEEPAKP